METILNSLKHKKKTLLGISTGIAFAAIYIYLKKKLPTND
jgi:hypothetical protein